MRGLIGSPRIGKPRGRPRGGLFGGRGTDTTPATITSSSAFSVLGSVALSRQLTANEAGSWATHGGADVALFTLSAGGLLELPGQNYAVPGDADANNTFILGVRFTDHGGNVTDQTITVTVTDPALSYSAGYLIALKAA